MKATVTTLVEGRHFLGVAALYNSLVASGFDGEFVVGHRGMVPTWFRSQLAALQRGHATPVSLEPVEFEGHLTNLKPHWMLRLFETRLESEQVTYLDPDVCLIAPWSRVWQWCKSGIGVAENPSTPLHEGDWRVIAWSEFAASRGLILQHRTSAYVNGGFVSIPRGLKSFVARWQNTVENVGDVVGGLWVSPLPGGRNGHLPQDRFDPFHFHDQDALNVAIRTGDEPLRILAQDGMGFVPGVAFMSHALGTVKPWDRRFIRESLAGRKPSFADKTYFSFCDGPLRPFAKSTLKRKRVALKLACAIRGRGWS